MSDDPQIRIERFNMPDTGLGREAGFGSDRQMIEAHQAALAGLREDARARIEDFQREIGRAFLEGR